MNDLSSLYHAVGDWAEPVQWYTLEVAFFFFLNNDNKYLKSAVKLVVCVLVVKRKYTFFKCLPWGHKKTSSRLVRWLRW